jgi:hypothetical protein
MPDVRIHHCSVAELRHYVEPDSIDTVATDPPYTSSCLSVYDDLAEFASFALKPGGSLLCMTGQSYLPTVIEKLSRRLTYHWLAAYLTPRLASSRWDRKVNCFWKPLLWFTKGEYAGDWIGDVCKSNGIDKAHHRWGQSESGMADILERWTKPGQLVCDPFLGGGVTAVICARMGRKFIGCDNDPEAIAKSLARLSQPIVVQQEKSAAETMREMRGEGKSFREIAEHLNSLGKRTKRGLPFTAQNVAYLLQASTGQDERVSEVLPIHDDESPPSLPVMPTQEQGEEKSLNDYFGVMKSMRDEGKTFAEIASRLNKEGHRTPSGKPFTPQKVAYYLGSSLHRSKIS